MNEQEDIISRYERRKNSGTVKRNNRNTLYSSYIAREREKIYKEIIQSQFREPSAVTLLEIGAGSGYNIPFFQSLHILSSNIIANELLPDRVEVLKRNYPEVRIIPGDILDADINEKVDILFQSTVFSSVLDPAYRQKMAHKMLHLLKENGIILWYDFIYNNPNNPDVRKVTANEIRSLFPGCLFEFRKVTLAPPIGRRIGRLYPVINNLFPFLRSHLIAVIRKKPAGHTSS